MTWKTKRNCRWKVASLELEVCASKRGVFGYFGVVFCWKISGVDILWKLNWTAMGPFILRGTMMSRQFIKKGSSNCRKHRSSDPSTIVLKDGFLCHVVPGLGMVFHH